MNITKDNSLKFLLGYPVLYGEVCVVKSPKIKEIAAVGLSNFYQYISLLTIQKPHEQDNEVSKMLEPLSDFEYLVLLSQMDKKTLGAIQSAFKLFTGEKIKILSAPTPTIIVGDPQEKKLLTADNYYGFSRLVRQACAMLDADEEEIVFEEDDSPQVRAIKEKLLKGRRDREAARSRKKDASKSSIDLTDLIGSLPIGSSSYNLLNIGDLTYYAFQDQLKRTGWHEEFDINTRASLAGAKLDKSKLAYWMKAMTFK